jgi:very-short-patch-repair endonuclease
VRAYRGRKRLKLGFTHEAIRHWIASGRFAQQARDRLRDQAHTAAGLTGLRFTDEQIGFEQKYVERTLRVVARRLRSAATG